MNAVQSNKIKRVQTLKGVLDEHQPTWSTLPAFARAVTELALVIPQITDTVQSQLSRSGATQEKRLIRQTLGEVAAEIAAAVLAHAEENNDAELAGRVDLSRSEILAGRDPAVVARCRDIHAAATAIVTELADAGLTAAKLTAFAQQIDAFEGIHTKPRQNQARRHAATRQLPALLTKVDRIVNRRLSKLVVQFKSTAPDFYNAYQTAVTIVDAGTGPHPAANGHPANPTPTPA